MGSAFDVIDLRRDSALSIEGRGAIAKNDTGDAVFHRRDDDDERAQKVGSAILDDERRLVASDCVAKLREVFGTLDHLLVDARVCDGIERLQVCRVREDALSEGTAVEGSVGPEERRPEGANDFCVAFRPGQHNLSCERIGIDDGNPMFDEARSNSGLSATNATREAEHSDSHAVDPFVLIACSMKKADSSEGMATSAPRKVSRRKLLVFTGALTAAGVLGVVRNTGYVGPTAGASVVLSKAEWHTVVALARRIAASDGADAPSPDDVSVVTFVDAYVASMDAPVRKDLLQFFAYIEQIAPLACGLFSRFTRLSAVEQDRVLASLESSSSDLLRGGFQGVKALIFMGYYRDPRTWKIIGYDGPQVGRR